MKSSLHLQHWCIPKQRKGWLHKVRAGSFSEPEGSTVTLRGRCNSVTVSVCPSLCPTGIKSFPLVTLEYLPHRRSVSEAAGRIMTRDAWALYARRHDGYGYIFTRSQPTTCHWLPLSRSIASDGVIPWSAWWLWRCAWIYITFSTSTLSTFPSSFTVSLGLRNALWECFIHVLYRTYKYFADGPNGTWVQSFCLQFRCRIKSLWAPQMTWEGPGLSEWADNQHVPHKRTTETEVLRLLRRTGVLYRHTVPRKMTEQSFSRLNEVKNALRVENKNVKCFSASNPVPIGCVTSVCELRTPPRALSSIRNPFWSSECG